MGQALHHAGGLADEGGHAAAGHRRCPPGRAAGAPGRAGPPHRQPGEAVHIRGPGGGWGGPGAGRTAAGEPRRGPEAGAPGGGELPGRCAGGAEADACRPPRRAGLGGPALAASR